MKNIYLLTGFLGAGKTTLLKALLKSYEDHKIGVIVNEFGEIDVDAKLVERAGISMAELTNGSIFCACIQDKFVESLIQMCNTDIEYLFIEASGLADPANMGQIFESIRNKIKGDCVLRGSICVTDAQTFLTLYDILPALEYQTTYASAVIINKADLVDEDEIFAISEKIEEVNPGVAQYVTSYCKIDIKEVADNLTVSTKESRESSNTYETRPNSFVLKADGAISYNGLKLFLEEIAASTYRIKGFALTDKGNTEVSTVTTNINLNPWEKEVDSTEIVAISSIGIKLLSQIVAASNKHLDGKLKL